MIGVFIFAYSASTAASFLPSLFTHFAKLSPSPPYLHYHKKPPPLLSFSPFPNSTHLQQKTQTRSSIHPPSPTKKTGIFHFEKESLRKKTHLSVSITAH